MEEIIYYIISFLLIYLIYFLLIINNKKRKNKLYESTEVKYLIQVYKLKNIKTKFFPHLIALANSFIITTAVTIVLILDNFILQFLVGFFVLIILNLFIYHLIGIYYRKKENK
ncbi:MAG: hypothetical protein R3Y21_05325 [Mycoplasmatota bacterium]